jgi:hypothetical protein
MGRPKVAEFALAAALVTSAASGCSDHHVSAWGTAEHPSLAPYIDKPDLARHLATIEHETTELGLSLASELEARIPGEGRAIVRAYEGVDVGGRRVSAVRAATARGVIMAVGPLDAGDLGRTAATELVPSLAPGDDGEKGAWQSGTDLNGDGRPDVVLRNEAGALEIWGLGATSAGRYDVWLEAPPTRGLDVDGDGRVELAGTIAVLDHDAIAPELEDVAFFDGARYSDRTEAARALHEEHVRAIEAERVARRARPRPDADADAGAPAAPPPLTDELRLRRALELAWHAILAGRDRGKVLGALDLEPVPARLRASFDRHRRVVSALTDRSRASRERVDRVSVPR